MIEWSGYLTNLNDEAGPIGDVRSHQNPYPMSNSNIPPYVPSDIQPYPYMQVGASDVSGGWETRLGSHKDEYGQAHPYSSMYAPPSIPSDSTSWGHPVPVRSMSYSGEVPGTQTHAQYEPGRRPSAIPDVSHHDIAAPMPISGAYAPVVPSQLPSQGPILHEQQQQRQYQEGDPGYGEWVYVRSDQGHDVPYYQSN